MCACIPPHAHARAMGRPQWASRNAFGITKYIRLATYAPSIVFTDVVVRTSVSTDTVSFVTTVANYGQGAADVTIDGSFAAWSPQLLPSPPSSAASAYPSVPRTSFTIAAGAVKTVEVNRIAWSLGESSYWWPNKPFKEDYTATLHTLTLTATATLSNAAADSLGTGTTATVARRFGFVEWSEAANNGTWYLVNGRRINFISDATPEAAMSSYDCYTVSPAFSTLEGAKETWKRYMRLGISANSKCERLYRIAASVQYTIMLSCDAFRACPFLIKVAGLSVDDSL